MTTFESLELNSKITDDLIKKGYDTPTPIQADSIPHILLGKDVLGIAQTGTGKTAAFSLPTLHNLVKSGNVYEKKGVRALIISPTRELTSQIADNIKTYGKSLNLRFQTVFGGVSIHNQIKALERGTDILIATPGRLIDLINRGAVKLHQVEILILDEADRMLDMGFIGDIKKIAAKTPKERQTILFSATMPQNIANLADSMLRDPIRVEVAKQSTTAEKITQKVYFVDKSNKPELLKHILESEKMENILIFSKTKYGADRISKRLNEDSIDSAAIHGNKTQSNREKALKNFRQGRVKVLVATDIAARGIDVSTITHVINYDLPQDPENYVHRIGRTARAGKDGIAITLCDRSDHGALKAIEKITNIKLEVVKEHPFHDSKEAPRSRDASASAGDKKPRNSGPRSSAPRNYSKDSAPRARTGSSSRFNDSRPRSSDSASGERRSFGGARSARPRSSEDRPYNGGATRTRFDDARSSENQYHARTKADGGRSEGSSSYSDRRKDSGSFGERKSFGGQRSNSSRPSSARPYSPRSGESRPYRSEGKPRFGEGRPAGNSSGYSSRPRSSEGSSSNSGGYSSRPRSSEGSSSDRRFGEGRPAARRPSSGTSSSYQGGERRKQSGGSNFGGGFGGNRSSRPSSSRPGSSRPSFKK